MGDELESRSLYIVLPNGVVSELPAGSVNLEPEGAHEPPDFSGIADTFGTITFTIDVAANDFLRAYRLLLRAQRMDMRMHHRRRCPWGGRYEGRRRARR